MPGTIAKPIESLKGMAFNSSDLNMTLFLVLLYLSTFQFDLATKLTVIQPRNSHPVLLKVRSEKVIETLRIFTAFG